MNYQKNNVASIFKIYSFINFFVCIIVAVKLDLRDLSIFFIATAIVVCVGIYAIGEVIQLLDEIKQNTSRIPYGSKAYFHANNSSSAENVSDANTVSPANVVANETASPDGRVCSCPNCGCAIFTPGLKACLSCGQILEWNSDKIKDQVRKSL